MENRVVCVGDKLDGHDGRIRIVIGVAPSHFVYKFKDPTDTKWFECPYQHSDFRDSLWNVVPGVPACVQLPEGI